jgi:hypothetical protein
MTRTLKTIVASLALIGASLTAPTMASAEDEACLLRSGCFFTNTDTGGYWTCPGPQVYQDCVTPAG